MVIFQKEKHFIVRKWAMNFWLQHFPCVRICLLLTHLIDPSTKTAHSPKLDKKERFFQWCMWYRTELDFNVFFIHWRTRKMPFSAFVFTLRSKVELNWTRAIRPVIAQSVQFSKIAKKLNIDLCQFFSHRKEALSLLKSWNKKWGSPYSFLR